MGDIVKDNKRLYMKTPRSVSFDGNRLVVGDYNAATIFIYKGLPIQDGQEADYIITPGIHKTGTGMILADGITYATMDNTIYARKRR